MCNILKKEILWQLFYIIVIFNINLQYPQGPPVGPAHRLGFAVLLYASLWELHPIHLLVVGPMTYRVKQTTDSFYTLYFLQEMKLQIGFLVLVLLATINAATVKAVDKPGSFMWCSYVKVNVTSNLYQLDHLTHEKCMQYILT